MAEEKKAKGITIKDAITKIENIRSSTLISYIAAQNALISLEDASILVDVIEMVAPSNAKIDKLDLFLHSPGGFLDPAYKLTRICQDYSYQFNVIVPLFAKSAATVVCLGADEIVMTSLSELGPIDPVIQHPYKPDVRVPARSIKDFFQFLTATETDQIKVDTSFKEKMAALLDPYLIGSYQTAIQSSKQIAEMLLSQKQLKDHPERISDTVNKLTEYYYSHGFVIDRQAATDIGLNITNADTNPELKKSIRQLFRIYQQFMQANKISKLVGNRDRNIYMQIAPQVSQPPSQDQTTDHLFG